MSRRGRIGLITAGVISVGLVIATLVMVWAAWSDLGVTDPWEEFQTSTSPDGRWTIVLEQAVGFGFGPTRVRVLVGEGTTKPVQRETLGVGEGAAYLTGCGVQFMAEGVEVSCVDDLGGADVVTISLE